MKYIGVVLILFSLCAICNSATIYYCPKCGSTDIEIVNTDPPPVDNRVSMDEWPMGITSVTLEMRYSHYRLTCKRCWYVVESVFPK